MFLDASAMIAIIAGEAEATAFAARLGQAAQVFTAPIAIYEAVLGLARVGRMPVPDAGAILDRFLDQAAVRIMPITAEIGRDAVSAFERFGKGRHAAALNMGDCFAYACARSIDVPLLFKGDDFPQTDIEVA
jgi:ribonuclease VapC